MSDESTPTSVTQTLPPIPPELARIIEGQRAELEAVRRRETESSIKANLASAINRHASELLPDVSDQVEALLRPHLRIAQSGADQAVVGPQMQTVEAFVAEQLGSPKFGHFRRARNLAGTANPGQYTQGGSAPPAAFSGAPAAQPQPRNLGEAALLHMQQQIEAKNAARAAAGGHPASDRSQAFALTASPDQIPSGR